MNIVNSKALSACLGGLALLTISFTQAQAATVNFFGGGGLGPTTPITDPFAGTSFLQFVSTPDVPFGLCTECSFNFAVDYDLLNGLSTGSFEFLSEGASFGSGSLEKTAATTEGTTWTAEFAFTGGTFNGVAIADGLALVSGDLVTGVIESTGASVTTVPLPAAVWLFGSALGMIGVIGGARRRAKATA
jgi:hypothetical protein